MGLRSFLGLKKKEPKDDNDNNEKKESENPEDIKMALEAIKADLEAYTGETAPEAREGDVADDADGDGNGNALGTKKRKNILNNLNRNPLSPPPKPVAEVAGETTSASTYGETVQHRIQRVKSGQMTEDEKAAFLSTALTRTPPARNGPKVRQEIPSNSADVKAPKKNSSASPFPNDALWNTVIGKKTSPTSTDGRGTTRYPNIKFGPTGERLDDSVKRDYLDMVMNPDRFKRYAAMGGYKTPPSSPPQADSPNVIEEDFVVENQKIVETPTSSQPSSPPDIEEEKLVSRLESAANNLASRLESAAIIKEKKDAEAKLQRIEEERKRKAAFEEEQKRRAEEMRMRDVEALEAKRREEEINRQKEEAARDAELQRLAAMQAQQDDYWAKKLQEERARKEKTEGTMDEEQQDVRERRLERAIAEQAKAAEIERMREEQMQRQDPHESRILQEAAEDELHEREKNADVMEIASAKASNTVAQSRPADVSSNSFVEQEERKKRQLDQLRKEQNDRLASLNSPLPVNTTPPPKVETNRPKPVSKPPPSSPAIPRLNLADLTMKKKKTEVNTPPPPAPSPSSASAPRLSLAEMTMWNPAKKAQSQTKTPPSSPASISSMDDNEDDFFEYSRDGGNSGMSLKDIMAASGDDDEPKPDAAKQQAKKWGIDIDKFLD